MVLHRPIFLSWDEHKFGVLHEERRQQMHLLEGIPTNVGTARDQWILDAIASGQATYEFAPVHSTYNGHEATFYIFRDALKIDGVRILVTAKLAQQIADLLDCSLLTPKLADLLFEQGTVRLPPLPRQPVTSDTKTMIAQSERIDKEIDKAGGDDGGIIQTVGKHWVLVNKINGTSKAANYGWHFEGKTFGGQKYEATVSIPGGRLIQGVGTAHNASHVDYSQNLVLVSNDVEVDGETVRLQDLLQDPEYAGLASHEGVLKVLRQPGVSGSISSDHPTVEHPTQPTSPTSSSSTVPASSPTKSNAGAIFGMILGGVSLGVLGYLAVKRSRLQNGQ